MIPSPYRASEIERQNISNRERERERGAETETETEKETETETDTETERDRERQRQTDGQTDGSSSLYNRRRTDRATL